mgnify:CR=1 FL=1
MSACSENWLTAPPSRALDNAIAGEVLGKKMKDGSLAKGQALQLPLYLAGNVTWLGIQAIPLGLPLFLLVCWVTFVILARVPLANIRMAGRL